MRAPTLQAAAPVAAAAALGILCLVLAPATADMAAHEYRAGLWAREGPAVWNARWYGGHHVLGYSLLFSAPAAAVGARLPGVLAGVAAVALFGSLARGRAGAGTTATAATWLFAGGVMSNVVIGRMPFTVGIALAVAAWACADRGAAGGRRWLAGAAGLALAATWTSPVAGAYLGLAAAARAAGGGRGQRATAAALALPALAGGLALAALFPGTGPDRFTAAAFWPMLAVCLAGAALLDPRRRTIAAGALLYLAVLAGAFAVPSPFGQNALRLGVLLGPPLLVLAARPRAPRAALGAVLAALVYLAWLPAVRAVAEAGRDPAAAAAFQAEALAFLGPRLRPGERVEVPLTLNHWEAAHLARALPLARGWERQLDIAANALFYDGRPLTASRYGAWLRDRGVAWVALPAAPLDYSARAERALLERGAPYLRPAGSTGRWRFWRVAGARAVVRGAGRLTAAGAGGFALRSPGPGTTVVRERWTRYWSVTRGDACLHPARGWTAVRARSAGTVVVRARFSPARALGRGPGRCDG
jgi:hypothetical protein